MGDSKKNVKKGLKKAAKKIKKVVTSAKVHIHASFNNTIVTITCPKGDVLAWDTAGKQGFKGSRKSTPHAAAEAAKAAAQKVSAFGVKIVDIFVKGPGPGRDSAARAFDGFFKILSISDDTPPPHNGCRGEKKRRV